MSDFQEDMMERYEDHNKNKKGGLALGITIVTITVVTAVLVFALIAGSLIHLFANRDKYLRPAPSESRPGEMVTLPTQGEDPDPQGSGEDPDFSIGDLTPSRPPGDGLSVPEIVEKVKPAVVAIYTDVVVSDLYGGLQESTVSGSGFIITASGYVVTNAHVIENARSIHVNLEDGRTYETTLVGSDAYADIAVLKIDAQDLPYAELGDSSRLRIGEAAIAIGNPTGRLSGTVTSGIISALDRELSESPIPLIQTDAALNPGNSGGALINSSGQVIGINQLKIIFSGSGSVEQIQGISFAIPINAAKPIIEGIIQTGRYIWPMMGITVSTVEENLAQAQGIHYPGVAVVSVERGGPGDQAGLLAGDVIARFDGQPVATTRQLADRKNEKNPGDEVTLTIYRGSEEMTVKLILGGSA